MKNIFYSYKDFLMCNNIVILDYFDAVKYLNISNKQKQILQAVKLENKIKIINKYVICPYCGNKILPYNKHKFSKIPKNIIKLFGSETFADEFKDISFNILEYDAIKFKCSYCLNTGIISENKTKFIIEETENTFKISLKISNYSQLSKLSWLKDLYIPYTNSIYYESLTFNLDSGQTTLSFENSEKNIKSILLENELLLSKSDPIIKEFYKFNPHRKITRMFGNWYGKIPIKLNTLRINQLMLLIKFVGYDEQFYNTIPLSLNKQTLIHKNFIEISNKMHYSNNVANLVLNYKFCDFKSTKKIIFQNPGLLFYIDELNRLWKIFENLDSFNSLIKLDNIFSILAFFNILKGIDKFFIDSIKHSGATAIIDILKKNELSIYFANAVCYVSLNEIMQKEFFKKSQKSNINLLDGLDFSDITDFSYPLSNTNKSENNYNIKNFNIIYISSYFDYYSAGKELNNCLVNPICIKGDLYLIIYNGNILGSIEIINNQITQYQIKDKIFYDVFYPELFFDIIKRWCKIKNIVINTEY